MVIENSLLHKIKPELSLKNEVSVMFTFVQTQTEPGICQFFTKENSAFWQMMQKALLISLYHEKLISDEEYQQCLFSLGNEGIACD